MRKANLFLVMLIVSLELFITSTRIECSRYMKALAWVKLVKTWAALRYDDTKGMDMASLHLTHRGLEACLTRTKTTGPGKRIEKK